MQIFIKDHDYDLWKTISNGDFIPTMMEGDKIVPKPRFTHKGTEKVTNNYLNSNEFNCVSTCDTTKEV